MPSPHDALFHEVFSVPEDALGYLASVSPDGVADVLDWATLERYPATFKAVDTRGAHADLVHRVRIAGTKRHLYLLLEHKSHADPLIALQVHRYVHRLIDKVRQDEPSDAGLALVLPVVVYHGDRAWDGGPQLPSLFRCPESLSATMAPFLPEVRYVFDDLGSPREVDLVRYGASAYARIALEALRYGRTTSPLRSFFRRVRPLVHELANHPRGGEKLASIYAYLAQVRGLPREEMAAIIRQELGPEQEQRMQSTYDQIYQDGQIDAVRVVLATRFGSVPEELIERLRDVGPDRLRECIARAAEVARCDDLLREFSVDVPRDP
jgi:hypothetical protein